MMRVKARRADAVVAWRFLSEQYRLDRSSLEIPSPSPVRSRIQQGSGRRSLVSHDEEPWTLISVGFGAGCATSLPLGLWRATNSNQCLLARPYAPNAAPDDPLPIILNWVRTGSWTSSSVAAQ